MKDSSVVAEVDVVAYRFQVYANAIKRLESWPRTIGVFLALFGAGGVTKPPTFISVASRAAPNPKTSSTRLVEERRRVCSI